MHCYSLPKFQTLTKNNNAYGNCIVIYLFIVFLNDEDILVIVNGDFDVAS